MSFTLTQLFEYELYKTLHLSNNKNLILNNIFSIYDKNKTGYINKDGWKLSFKNLGLTNFSDKEFDILFYIYDTNNSGLINYFNFCEYFSNLQFNIYQNNYQQNSFNQNQNSNLYNNINEYSYQNSRPLNYNHFQNNINNNFQESQYRINVLEKSELERKNDFQSLIQLLKNEIKIDNMTYSYLSILLKNKQDPLTGTINFENFISCLNEAKINYNKKNIIDLYQLLDIYNQNKVSIVEILSLLRGDLKTIRREVIIKIFAYIDSERKNYIEIDKLKRIFNPNNHPDVISGKKNPDEVYKEFIFSLNNFIIYKGINNKISFDDFIEFFSGISATFENDLIFNNMMNNIFSQNNLFFRHEIKNNLSNNNINLNNENKKYPYINAIIKLKNYIISLGKKGIFEIEKQFYINDVGKTGRIDYNIFENICFKYSLNKEDIKELENIFDKYQTKMINYDLIIQSLIDKMSENRFNLVKKVFILLRPDVNGYIKIKDILYYYNYNKDPDIISGKKNKDMVKNELKYFLEIIKEYEFIKNKAAMDLMNFGEFINFYNQISMYIPNDKEFENLIKNVWRIESDRNNIYFNSNNYYHN